MAGTLFVGSRFPSAYARANVLVSEHMINVHSVNDGGADATEGLTKGVSLTGIDPAHILRFSLPLGQTYVGWSPWGRPDFHPSFPNASGSMHVFHVVKDDDVLTEEQMGIRNAYDGEEAARAAFPAGGKATIIGGSKYTFYIKDSPVTDNTGGVSIRVQVFVR